MRSVLAIGLGHLAKFLHEQIKLDNCGHQISLSGTYRNLEKVNSFDIDKYYFESTDLTSLNAVPQNFDILLLNLPIIENYSRVLEKIDQKFPVNTKIIFISSTSVYSEGEIDESSTRVGASKNGEKLILLEDYLKGLKREVTIIRPGGLIDSSRNPARFLARKDVISDSQLAINLIHTQDVARFILHILKKDLWNEDYNLVCDNHQSKEEFYSGEIARLALEMPKWQKSSKVSKIVSNAKVKQSGFSFLYPDLSLK